MANNKQNKPAVSFEEMIQADRNKRKSAALAQKIFGKDRRQSAPSAINSNNSNTTNAGRTAPLGGSLASRVGVTKRSASTASSPSLANNNSNSNSNGRQRRQQNRNGRQPQLATDSRAAAVRAAVEQTPAMPVLAKRPYPNGSGNEISIRGAAGPYCVVASNFVPGTTAADIESVMAPVGGEMAGCKLMASTSTVIAEMLFVDRAGAENVISMFNGKKADGRILYVYLKEGGPSAPVANQPPVAPRIASPVVVNLPETTQQEAADEVMEVDQPYPAERSPLPRNDPSPRPFAPRPPRDRASYREDYDRGPRHANPEYQDGRYGFPDQRYDGPQYDRRPRFRDEGRMYSDDMMRGGRRGGGGGGGGRGGRYR